MRCRIASFSFQKIVLEMYSTRWKTGQAFSFIMLYCHSFEILSIIFLKRALQACSMTSENPEADIGGQPKDQKNKAAKSLESSYL